MYFSSHNKLFILRNITSQHNQITITVKIILAKPHELLDKNLPRLLILVQEL